MTHYANILHHHHFSQTFDCKSKENLLTLMRGLDFFYQEIINTILLCSNMQPKFKNSSNYRLYITSQKNEVLWQGIFPMCLCKAKGLQSVVTEMFEEEEREVRCTSRFIRENYSVIYQLNNQSLLIFARVHLHYCLQGFISIFYGDFGAKSVEFCWMDHEIS